MTSPVRFGVVGCGNMGATAELRASVWPIADWWVPLSHAAAVRATAAAQLVAVCDVDASRVEEAQRLHGPVAGYADFRSMLEKEELDAVTVATRTPDRKAVILAALTSGVRAIFCEKPFANSLEDADEIAAEVVRHGAYFVLGTRRRFMPAYQMVRERISHGALGSVRSIVVRFGRGKLMWTHPHSVDVISFFAGDKRPVFVQADLELDGVAAGTRVIEDDPVVRMAHLRFEEMSAHIVVADSLDVDVCGTLGNVTIRSDGQSVHWRLPEGPRDQGWFLADQHAPSLARSGTVATIEAICRAVRDGVHPGYDVQQAVWNQEVLTAMVQSHLDGGRRVSLPLPRTGFTILGRTGDRFA